MKPGSSASFAGSQKLPISNYARFRFTDWRDVNPKHMQNHTEINMKAQE